MVLSRPLCWPCCFFELALVPTASLFWGEGKSSKAKTGPGCKCTCTVLVADTHQLAITSSCTREVQLTNPQLTLPLVYNRQPELVNWNCTSACGTNLAHGFLFPFPSVQMQFF